MDAKLPDTHLTPADIDSIYKGEYA
jgi:hypothetical protein